MNQRERLLTSLAHREPDRVPLDLGAGIACSIHVQAYEHLKRYLGLDTPTTVTGRFSQIANVEEEVLRRFDVDVRPLRIGMIGTGGPSTWSEEWQHERDEWGVVWAKPAFGHPYEIDSPLRHGEPTIADIINYPWPNPDDPSLLADLEERAKALRRETDCAMVLSLSFYPFTQSHLIRGHANWLMDLAGNRPFAEALLDAVTDALVTMFDRILGTVGDLADVVCWGDDVSIQTGPMISPAMFREVVKPRYRRVMDTIRRGTQAKVFFHTCGSVHWLVPELIDLGIDILNPVQVSAANMDTRRLKREFGDRITFWGGGCDSQSVLPFGTPTQVREEVRRRLGDLAPGGGFVFAPVHTIQADVPPENVVAMYEAALEFGRYGLRQMA
ncbi:MAG: uroporphyrinogen decarboxylase family protein [Chloroflexota bacterium]